MRIKEREFCAGCMKPVEKSSFCKYCGFIQKRYHPTPRCLPIGTVLKNRYVLGKVLGQGNFGITYIAWDSLLEIRVAIKEYFPKNWAERHVDEKKDMNVYIYDEEGAGYYQESLEKYLGEAKNLSRFSDLEGIVSIRDFFYANHTAYIIMNYIDGVSLNDYVKEDGKIPAKKLLEAMKPLVEALGKIHEEGTLHRDISPDNILITPDGKMRLIDFGASREDNALKTHTMTVVFKRGYSPEEQYRPRGKQGAWSDIYALCATMYYALTGQAPLESIERMIDDDIVSLSDMTDIDLTENQKKAVMKGMAVRPEQRYHQISELYQSLYENREKESTTGISKGKLWSVRRIAAGVSIVLLFLVMCFGVLYQNGVIAFRSSGDSLTKEKEDLQPAVAMQEETVQKTMSTENSSQKRTAVPSSIPVGTVDVVSTEEPQKPATPKPKKVTKKKKKEEKKTEQVSAKPSKVAVSTKAQKSRTAKKAAKKKEKEAFDAVLP